MSNFSRSPEEFEKIVAARNELVEQVKVLMFDACIPTMVWDPILDALREALSRDVICPGLQKIAGIPYAHTAKLSVHDAGIDVASPRIIS
jgi:hypothetical protein